MPKASASSKKPGNQTQRLVIIAAAVIFVVVGIVTLMVVFSRSASTEVACTEQEVKKGEAFYDEATIIKDGKRYIRICA